MAVTQTNSLWLQSEKVRPKLEGWLPKFKSLIFTKIDNKQVEKVSERDYRIPYKTTAGGKVRTYDPNMGAVGRGSSATGGVLISTFFPLSLAFELSELETLATESKEQAVASKFKMAMADAMPEFALYLDKFWHRGNGTADLAVATAHTTSGGNSVYTLDSSFGVAALRRGMQVRVQASNRTTYRTINTTLTETYIVAVDYDNNKVTLNGTVDSAAATDVLILAGTSGNNPVGMKGLPYYNSYATSGSTLGLDRSTEYEVITPNVNAAGGLTNGHGVQLLGKMLKRRGTGQFPNNIFGCMSFEVYKQLYDQVQLIQRIDLGGDGAKMVDTAGKQKMEFSWCGVPHYIDVNQDTTRVDWVAPAVWGWSSMKPMSFYEVGNTRFFPIYATDGSPAAGLWFALTVHRDSWCADPAQGGVIYGIS